MGKGFSDEAAIQTAMDVARMMYPEADDSQLRSAGEQLFYGGSKQNDGFLELMMTKKGWREFGARIGQEIYGPGDHTDKLVLSPIYDQLPESY